MRAMKRDVFDEDTNSRSAAYMGAWMGEASNSKGQEHNAHTIICLDHVWKLLKQERRRRQEAYLAYREKLRFQYAPQ